MFDLTSENDNGINQGRERNLWRASITLGQYEVFTTPFEHLTPAEAMGAAQGVLASALKHLMAREQQDRAVTIPSQKTETLEGEKDKNTEVDEAEREQDIGYGKY
jgi:hypothetical protein